MCGCGARLLSTGETAQSPFVRATGLERRWLGRGDELQYPASICLLVVEDGQSVRVFPCLARVLPSVSRAASLHRQSTKSFWCNSQICSNEMSGWRGRASIPVRSRGGPQIRRWSASAEDWPTNLPRDPNSPSPPPSTPASPLPSTKRPMRHLETFSA